MLRSYRVEAQSSGIAAELRHHHHEKTDTFLSVSPSPQKTPSMLSQRRLTARLFAISSTFSPFLPASPMSTFHLPNVKPEVPVHLTTDLSKDQLLGLPAFKTWIDTLQRSLSTQRHKSHTFHLAPYKLRRICIQSVDFFGERIGFLKLQAEVSNDNGEKLPGSVFLRGGSVGMLVCICACQIRC